MRVAPRRGLHHRLYGWVLRASAHRQAPWLLFLVAVVESSVFPVPPDVLLMSMTFARPRRALLYAGLTTVGSVLGGLIGFALGMGLWHVLGPVFFRHLGSLGFTPENFEWIQEAYRSNAFLAVFTAGLTPVPYKVFTIAAGVFEIGLGVFVFASILGRGGRFVVVALLVAWLGPSIQPFIERYLGWLTLAFAALVVVGFWVLSAVSGGS
jgi:membrane protein YqaA with SNARE-associated domain